ncbi:FecR domain-containing protein [bacterium]|nr:FecR domain-containing protein [bacterium]
MKLQNHEWERLARYFSGESSERETSEIEAWIEANPQYQKWMALLRQAWHVKQDQENINLEVLWKKIRAETGIRRQIRPRIVSMPLSRPWIKTFRIAASLILMAALGYWGLSTFFSGRAMAEVRVAYGEQKETTLPDGTEIILDAGSGLRYPKRFDQETRDVFLEGEGFFRVAEDPARPFVVHAQGAAVRVLGTQFNVRAWKAARYVKVSVIKGRVAFNRENQPKKDQVILHPGQMSRLSEGLVPAPPVQTDPDKETAWIRGEIELTDVPLQEVLDQLVRWYDVSFVCSDSKRLHERVTVHIQNHAMEDALEMISLLSGFKVTKNKNMIYLN